MKLESAAALAGAVAAAALAQAAEVAPAAPLYCDSGEAVAPLGVGYGAFLGAYRAAYGWPRQSSSERKDGGADIKVVVFDNGAGLEEDRESVAYTLTPHADGWALRSSSQTLAFGRSQESRGVALCETVRRIVGARPAG